MLAAIYNITCEQGATFTRELVWRQYSGDPKNLTGYTARMTCRPYIGADEVWLELGSETSGIDFLDRVNGKFQLAMTASTTSELSPGTGVYDLELVSSTGDVTRLMQGTFTVVGEVTT